jgi:hypothetical protein
MEIVKGKFKNIGINKIDIDLVVSKWNHLWILAEWERDNSWRVIKYIRKDSENTEIKLTISWRQANELVKRLDLKPILVGLGSGYSWRREKDWVYLDNWRREKYAQRNETICNCENEHWKEDEGGDWYCTIHDKS